MTFKLAAAQIDSRVGDAHFNLEKHLEYALRAKADRAKVLVFPELSITGYTLRDLTPDLSIQNFLGIRPVKELLKLSREISIIAGGVEKTFDHRYHNAAFLFDGGELKTIHRKIYLPTYGMFEERRYFLPGTGIAAAELASGRIGCLICEDVWHPSLVYLMAQDRASVLIGMAASPTRLGGDSGGKLTVAEVNHEHHRTYARLFSTYFVFVNRVGFEDGIGFWGGSTIFSPAGTQLAAAPYFEESLIMAEIDEGEVGKSRRESRHALDEDPFFMLRQLQRIVSGAEYVDKITKI